MSPKLKILLVNIALLLLGAIIIELIFGNWIRPNNLNRLNLTRDRKIRYNIEELYDSPSKVVVYTRDKYGLRGSFKRPSDITVLTIGGSTTDQRYIADGQTWQDVMQEKFKSIGKNIVVANAGVDGQSTYGHIKNFDWWLPYIPGLKPKYIFFYIGINDFYIEEGNKFDLLTIDEKDKSLGQIFEDNSALYYLYRTFKGIYQAYKYKIVHRPDYFRNSEWTQTPLQSSYDRLMETRLKEYAERLNILINKTNAFGSRAIFLTQPSRKYRLNNGRIEGIKETINYNNAPINGVDYYYMMRKLDNVTCTVAAERDILCLDLAKETIWQDEDFYDSSHTTPKGAKKIGEYLLQQLKDKI